VQALELLTSTAEQCGRLSFLLPLIALMELPHSAAVAKSVPTVVKALRARPWMTETPRCFLEQDALAVPLHPAVALQLKYRTLPSRRRGFAAWGPFLYFLQGRTLVQVRGCGAGCSVGEA